MNLRDGSEESPLGLALWTDQFDIAQQLIDIGADIESKYSDSPGMLYMAIVREKAKAARYLLDNGANFKKRFVIVLPYLLNSVIWGNDQSMSTEYVQDSSE